MKTNEPIFTKEELDDYATTAKGWEAQRQTDKPTIDPEGLERMAQCLYMEGKEIPLKWRWGNKVCQKQHLNLAEKAINAYLGIEERSVPEQKIDESE